MKPGISYTSATKTLTIWMSDRLIKIPNINEKDYLTVAAFIHSIYLEGHNDCLHTLEDSHGY